MQCKIFDQELFLINATSVLLFSTAVEKVLNTICTLYGIFVRGLDFAGTHKFYIHLLAPKFSTNLTLIDAYKCNAKTNFIVTNNNNCC